METQRIKMFAIEQAVRLISSTGIENKQKAVFDFADKVSEYVGLPTKEFIPFTPVNPIYNPSLTGSKPPTPQYEVTCRSANFDDIEHIEFDPHVQKYM